MIEVPARVGLVLQAFNEAVPYRRAALPSMDKDNRAMIHSLPVHAHMRLGFGFGQWFL
jgi:hypothetical protein